MCTKDSIYVYIYAVLQIFYNVIQKRKIKNSFDLNITSLINS